MTIFVRKRDMVQFYCVIYVAVLFLCCVHPPSQMDPPKWTPSEIPPSYLFTPFSLRKIHHTGILPFHRRNKPSYSLKVRPCANRAIFARVNFPFEGWRVAWGGWCISQIPILLLLPMAPCRDFFISQPTAMAPGAPSSATEKVCCQIRSVWDASQH